MVLDTGSELSWLQCNTTRVNQPTFDSNRSTSYSPINCSSPTCTTRTRDFSLPASCDPNNLCHATLSYADASSAEGNLASDTFNFAGSDIPGVVFGCMDSGFSSNSDEDSKTTGLMGMNRGSLSFVSQMSFPKFSYCISGFDFSGVLLLGDANFTWLTPLIQISAPLPYFDRVAYTVQLEGIKVSENVLPLPKSVYVPDHTGAGQTMVDSGTQFTFLLGPAYNVLRNEFLNQTGKILRVLDDPNFVFQGAMDLCYLVPQNTRSLPLLPTVSLMFRGAEMSVSGDRLLYRVRDEVRGNDSVYCFTFGNSELLGIEAYVIGNHHQQNMWMEFDLEKSRMGLAQVRCDLAGQRFDRVAECDAPMPHEEHGDSKWAVSRHGIRQLQSGWADGPAYITQCPIQTGQSYVYNYTIVGQRGTLFWHAHISWLRSTVYGPLIILPKLKVPYPFVKPYKEVPLIFGEWFNADTEAIISQALQTGGGPNVSDAYTINGLPGPLYNCSVKDTFKLKVKPGRTYLLRLINAALNDELFFSIANHTLTVVEADAIYVKPFETETLLVTPGQTTNVLLKTKPRFPYATFLMTARPYVTGLGTFDNSTVAGILEYESPSFHSPISIKKLPLFRPTLPPLNDTSFATTFSNKLRSLASVQFPANVPKNVDKRFFFTVGLGTSPCEQNQTCQGPNGTKFAASINNISFVQPTTALLQSHYSGQSSGVYNPEFPINPTHWFNYTGTPPKNTFVSNGTEVMVLPFNTSVELVMQDTSILGAESHPVHLHGFNFFVVGQGFGNYDSNKDPKNFNLIDPIERNTIGVPSGGWVAIRFLADNPGVWFMHCHLEVHTSWGLKMAWLVLDGKLPNQKLLPPPADLPKC
ncbi:hypothetical protein RJ639_023693 [Escallonia herrerae]|uniref:Laccase n=1 Tax=Escallonia herrerae TaxID=1293975 RepID=A0AA89AEL6_9ASTE|nr:hypothetical protein RJ639_023693 [Escallonia herrerae]